MKPRRIISNSICPSSKFIIPNTEFYYVRKMVELETRETRITFILFLADLFSTSVRRKSVQNAYLESLALKFTRLFNEGSLRKGQILVGSHSSSHPSPSHSPFPLLEASRDWDQLAEVRARALQANLFDKGSRPHYVLFLPRTEIATISPQSDCR